MRGVFQVRSTFGYTVMVDDVTIPMDLSWTDVDALMRFIVALQFTGELSSREFFVFHFDNRPDDYWRTYDDDHDPGDEDKER